MYFPVGAFGVHMNRENVDALVSTVCHETLHHLIEQNVTYGNESARTHFCGANMYQ